MERKHCKICGKELGENNKTGYCCVHRPRTGANNPFYGRKHKKETIEALKNKCSLASKKKWEDEEYRNKVIHNATGLKRSEEFKQKQRDNAIKQFNDKKQRDIRAKKMHESWENGALTFQRHESINESKQEKEYLKMVEGLGYKVSYDSFLYQENGKKRHMFPDGIIESEKIIIEYNGSFWHADPRRGYKYDDIIHHNKTAQEIWNRDEEKKKTYEKNGYKMFVVWSDDFLKNKEKCIEDLKKFINENKVY